MGPVVETRSRRHQGLCRLTQLAVTRRQAITRRCDRPAAALFGCCFAVRRLAALQAGFDGNGMAMAWRRSRFLQAPAQSSTVEPGTVLRFTLLSP